ncbi:MAG TPA: DUF2252 domain-containing protein [Candidatus Angelobacter sp.]|nr:DUF2252 domain-containing protein [Candidatus Angelobacter sp.]
MLSRSDAERLGVAQRGQLGRSSLAKVAKRNFDPLDVIAESCRGHIPKLVPEKFKRMRASAFAFFRGAVEVMAADLGAGENTEINVQLCGDAHLKNFGFFASPGADIVLDINDFDQTQLGPWEWDVKRLATSVVLAGRSARCNPSYLKDATRLFLAEYAGWMRRFAAMPTLDVARHRAVRDFRVPAIRSALQEAERSTPLSNLAKLTSFSKTRGYRFISKPEELLSVTPAERKAVLAALTDYRKSLRPEQAVLFDHYSAADVAFKVAGTGSVGTRDYVVLLFGRESNNKAGAKNGNPDPLFLQIKEELPSAYASYYKDRTLPHNQGERVVAGQRAMQVYSDPLLGWCHIDERDYLVRQLSDHKSGIDPEQLSGRKLAEYSRICGELLAKGHARSGDPAVIAAYIGRSDRAEKALLQFALKYADQTEKDFNAFTKALSKGFAARVLKKIKA